MLTEKIKMIEAIKAAMHKIDSETIILLKMIFDDSFCFLVFTSERERERERVQNKVLQTLLYNCRATPSTQFFPFLEMKIEIYPRAHPQNTKFRKRRQKKKKSLCPLLTVSQK